MTHVFLPLCTPTGLRKVTDDMKTHKNPSLRAGNVVKADAVKKAEPAPKAAPKFGAAAAKKKPVCELQNKKWVVVSGYCFAACHTDWGHCLNSLWAIIMKGSLS